MTIGVVPSPNPSPALSPMQQALMEWAFYAERRRPKPTRAQAFADGWSQCALWFRVTYGYPEPLSSCETADPESTSGGGS